MKNLKEVRVVRLPSENETQFGIQANGEMKLGRVGVGVYQHLVFIPIGEKIKEGDYYINGGDEIVHACDISEKAHSDPSKISYPIAWEKIIATTDKSFLVNKSNELETNYDYLPNIHESFIKEYVKSNGEIDKVLVELTTCCNGMNTSPLVDCRECTVDKKDYPVKTKDGNIVIILPVGEGMITNYKRIKQIKESLKIGTITNKDKDELVVIVYKNGSISKKFYDDYFKDGGSDEIFKMCDTIASLMLAGQIFKKLKLYKSIDSIMEELEGKLRSRVVYSMDLIKSEFGIDTGNLKGTLTQMDWGIQYSRKDLKK